MEENTAVFPLFEYFFICSWGQLNTFEQTLFLTCSASFFTPVSCPVQPLSNTFVYVFWVHWAHLFANALLHTVGAPRDAPHSHGLLVRTAERLRWGNHQELYSRTWWCSNGSWWKCKSTDIFFWEPLFSFLLCVQGLINTRGVSVLRPRIFEQCWKPIPVPSQICCISEWGGGHSGYGTLWIPSFLLHTTTSVTFHMCNHTNVSEESFSESVCQYLPFWYSDIGDAFTLMFSMASFRHRRTLM